MGAKKLFSETGDKHSTRVILRGAIAFTDYDTDDERLSDDEREYPKTTDPLTHPGWGSSSFTLGQSSNSIPPPVRPPRRKKLRCSRNETPTTDHKTIIIINQRPISTLPLADVETRKGSEDDWVLNNDFWKSQTDGYRNTNVTSITHLNELNQLSGREKNSSIVYIAENLARDDDPAAYQQDANRSVSSQTFPASVGDEGDSIIISINGVCEHDDIPRLQDTQSRLFTGNTISYSNPGLHFDIKTPLVSVMGGRTFLNVSEQTSFESLPYCVNYPQESHRQVEKLQMENDNCDELIIGCDNQFWEKTECIPSSSTSPQLTSELVHCSSTEFSQPSEALDLKSDDDRSIGEEVTFLTTENYHWKIWNHDLNLNPMKPQSPPETTNENTQKRLLEEKSANINCKANRLNSISEILSKRDYQYFCSTWDNRSHNFLSLPLNMENEKQHGMASLRVSPEGRDYLMWCLDPEFDAAVATLDMRGLVELVHTLQDTMAVEQQTFESLSKQLEEVKDPLLQQRMSAALCTSQTRLARLCSRNMRCFTQQALKSKQKGGGGVGDIDSRSSSPRDSGFAFSSSGSDFEGDLRGPSASPRNVTGGSFKNSLAFFQKAASIVSGSSHNFRSSKNAGGHRGRESKRSPKKRSSLTILSKDPLPPNDFVDRDEEDLETYEQVLFINGKPQYLSDSRAKRSHSYDDFLDSRSTECGVSRISSPASIASTTIRIHSDSPTKRSFSSPTQSDASRSHSYTRVQIGNTCNSLDSDSRNDFCNGESVDFGLPQRPVRLKDSLHSKSLSDVNCCVVSPPRRKPVLNFGRVSGGSSDDASGGGGSEFEAQSLLVPTYPPDLPLEGGQSLSVGAVTIKRSHSYKEGLDHPSLSSKSSNLCRTRSCCDGLSFKGLKLSRAPSVEEILDSVKSLRAKKSNMVKSNPDLLQTTEKSQQSVSLRHHKNSKSTSKTNSKSSGTNSKIISTTALVGVRFNGSVGTTTTETRDEPEQHYYENLRNIESINQNQYENLQLQKAEVIYDRPKSTKKVEKRRPVDKTGPVDFYENVNFDQQPLYENVGDNEPTYMNVTGPQSSSKRSSKVDNVYANVKKSSPSKSSKKSSSRPSSKSKSSAVDKNHQTYDVPKSASHIYDTPSKQTRPVVTVAASDYDEVGGENSDYDTPRNNRSVDPPSSQIMMKAKTEQSQKIDDIFADCEDDLVLEDGQTIRTSPRIPPPDYGIEDEDDLALESARKSASSPGEYIDEGLGETDSRTFFAEDQGLEVILEEPEEDDYCSSHSSEEDLRRRIGVQLRFKGKRRSLDGSEGIGSADSHSSGSEIGVEDDCVSSGVHSADTPSPGPPHESIADDLKKIDSKPQNRREDDRTQRDCCVEVYPETLRQRQRNMAPSPNKVDIKNWEPLPINNNNGDESKCSKKLLPSVKALRNQFENGKASQRDASPPARDAMSSSTTSSNLGRTSSNSSTSSLAMSSLEVSSGFGSLTSSQTTLETSTPRDQQQQYDDEPVEPIFRQFQSVDQQLRDLTSKPPSTTTWDPIPLLKKLYYVPETPKIQEQKTNYINIDGYLEKLPSGRKKATFWNAWKRRYFVAKDGVLYYYQNEISEKPNMKLPLMGGKVEIMEPNMVSVDDGEKEIRGASMLGIDDGKGHYVVVRCISRQEAEKWKKALDTHVADDFSAQFVNPWPQPTNPSLLRDTLVVDIGSCSVRAGVLASQPTLPQLFFPSIMATKRDTRKQILGMEALSLEARTGSVLTFPVRPSHKISKFSVDLNAISSLLQKTFTDLNVDPRNYNLQLSVPRVLNPYTQAELLKILFEKFEIKSVNLTHQSILALYAYNATSGIVVDIGERIDVVPVIDGYIVDGGVSRVPYGGHRIMEHLRHFLFQRNLSLVNEVDSYVIREVMETVCYSAQHYNTEKSRCNSDPESFDKTVDMTDYFPDQSQFEAFRSITLDYGRFQATEGIFNPDAWGLDHPGLHKLVHKAIQECSMDIRKEMSRSIFLVGGVSQLPGIAERLSSEIDNLTPPAIRPKVHASPYRYHGSYLGACVLAESPAFHQSKITKEEWQKQGNAALRKWAL